MALLPVIGGEVHQPCDGCSKVTLQRPRKCGSLPLTDQKEDCMAQWYYVNAGVETGPIDKAAFADLVQRGVVGSHTLVWTDTLEHWEPAHRHIDGVTPPRPDVPTSPAYAPADDSVEDYRRQSGLGDAFRQFFHRYAQFGGRSNRGAFWFWQLDNFLIGLALGIVDAALFGSNGASVLDGLWVLVTIIPSFALSARRLHDIDKSGWWILLSFIPLIGWIVLLVWYCRAPDPQPNRFG